MHNALCTVHCAVQALCTVQVDVRMSVWCATSEVRPLLAKHHSLVVHHVCNASVTVRVAKICRTQKNGGDDSGGDTDRLQTVNREQAVKHREGFCFRIFIYFLVC